VTVIAVTSAKHSPGATTLALSMVAAWAGDPARDGRPAVLVEADPAGGDLAARIGLSRDRGTASLAASSRRPDGPLDVAAHAQALPAGGWLVAGPSAPATAAPVVAAVAARLVPAGPGRRARRHRLRPLPGRRRHRAGPGGGRHRDRRGAPGRGWRGPPARPPRRPSALAGDRTRVVAVGDHPYNPAALAAVSGCPAAAVAVDPAGAATLVGAGRPGLARRSRLVRSVRPLLDAAVAATGQPVPA